MKPTVSLPPVVVGLVVPAGESGATASPLLRSVWLKMPSAKLLAHLAFAGVPDPESPGVGFATSAKWQLTPYVLAAEALSTRPAPLSPVFRECDGTEMPQPLPGGYEICSAVRLWRARLTMLPAAFAYTDDEGNALTADGYGRIVASCTLEPAPEVCLTEAEFRTLAQQCELWVEGGAVELSL